MNADTALPTLALVYGFGSVSPISIIQAAQTDARLLFLIDGQDPHCRTMRPVLEALAPTVDYSTAEDLASACTEASESPVRGILTFSDSLVRTTAGLAARLGLPYHRLETAAALTDKSRQRALLNAAGVSVTRQVSVADSSELAAAAATVGYPVVVKPVHGDSGRYTLCCTDKDELAQAVETVLPERLGDGPHSWEVEELLTPGRHPFGDWLGDYVSVESVTDASGTWHFAVSDKLPLAAPFREHGTIIPGMLPQELRDEVTAMAAAAVRALGVDIGITHTELKLTPQGPRVIEVNGRLGGGIAQLMNRCSDLDPVRLAVRTAVGYPVDRRPVVFDGSALFYLALPPQQRVRVRSAASASRFLRHPRVWDVDVFVQPGTVLDWRNGLKDRAFTIRAEGADHTEIAEVVRWLDHACAEGIEYEPAD
ncbi:acetyl-CoA carboxylase biotin carboxylase subunit family protein [Kitasatospora sp. GAS1066B]|uniref:ATP-grasp domain-containing protein n=1 Tax=Kitasatospora sp. GAS1066B TaxID=3156271 RepID=UPI003513EC87